MVRLGGVILLVLLTGCSHVQHMDPVIRAGVYHRIDNYKWNEDRSDTIFKSELGLRDDRLECVWTHISELDRGTPFNNKQDRLATELAGCSYDSGR
jgi:hypothetical protein